MAEPRVVIPLTLVRFRSATPKRTPSTNQENIMKPELEDDLSFYDYQNQQAA